MGSCVRTRMAGLGSQELYRMVLDSLPVQKVRYNLQPEDDVARIMSAY